MAAALAEAGARVMIADLLKDVGEQTAAERPGCGFVELDVTDDAAWEAAIAHTVASSVGSTSSSTTLGSRSPSCSSTSTPTSCGGCWRSTWWARRSASSTGCARCAPAARRAAAAPSSSRVGGRDHRVPGDRGLLGHEVGGRPAHPGGCHGVGQARLRRARQLHLPGLVPTEMGVKLAAGLVAAGLFDSAGGRRRGRRRADAARAARRGVRHGRCRGLPRLRRIPVHHRHRPAGRWRDGHVSTRRARLMGLTAYLDKGASLGPEDPPVTLDAASLLLWRRSGPVAAIARALARSGVARVTRSRSSPATTLVRSPACSASPVAGRCGARSTRATRWRRTASCWRCSTASRCSYARSRPGKARSGGAAGLQTVVCLDDELDGAVDFDAWMGGADGGSRGRAGRRHRDDCGHRWHHRATKGVLLTERNLETMTALTLMGYPFLEGRPVYLAMAPLTHAAGVLCFPIMALGGRGRRSWRRPTSGGSSELVEDQRVTHTFLPRR